MNRIFEIILLFLCLTLIISPAKSQELEFRTAPEYDVRVLIIPFDPRIYYNDATAEMARKTGESHDDIMMFFRSEFNRMLNVALMDSCIIIDLFSDDTRTARQDISDLYSTISYQMKPAMQNAPEHPDDEPRKGFFRQYLDDRKRERVNEKHQQSGTRIEKGQIVSNRQSNENKYVHIHFGNTAVLEEVARRRGVDLFLFINHFDIRGVYGTYMSGDPDNVRNLRVHFTMFDSQGNIYHGSYGHVELPFHLYNKQKIVDRYFPEVIRQIIHNIDFTY